MAAVLLLRMTYLSSASLVLFVFSVPALRSRFLDYGARNSRIAQRNKKKDGRAGANVASLMLDRAAALRVPHSWFTSFYAVSVVSSLFWASELLLKGPTFGAIAKYVPAQPHAMSFRQVLVVWAMMLAQGSRRLYECTAISRSSSSEMWFGHWAIGIFFYVATGVAVWIEGSATILTHQITVRDLGFEAPNISTFIGVMIFLLASGLQHDCHAYLASLKDKKKDDNGKSEYRLPEHPAFNISLTPHYFAECMIYLSLTIVAAPQGCLLNWTFASALCFVAINLGVTAYGTKQWYGRKFGAEAVREKSRMIPFLF